MLLHRIYRWAQHVLMNCNLNGNFKYILIVSAVQGWVNSEFEISENVILLNYCYKLVIKIQFTPSEDEFIFHAKGLWLHEGNQD